MKVVLQNLLKRFGGQQVVKSISLTIEDGEFFTLLGPSGCGKTTLLRLLAGFAVPDGGEIFFGDQPMSRVAPHHRETGMVFQNYALFPQMSVFDNVAYGLRARKAGAAEIRDKVGEALASVKLEDLSERYPSQLSGGQQQRVALARAMVIRPRVLLMDEPLSNLDAKLRLSMREEIRRIQKNRKITTVYVTHDQEEAMAVSDRIAILSAGNVEQVGSPDAIYYEPSTRFAAQFMGSCNLIELTDPAFDAQAGRFRALVGQARVEFAAKTPPASGAALMLRPEWLRLAGEEPGAQAVNVLPATIVTATFLGSSVSYQVLGPNGQELKVSAPDPGPGGMRREGDRVWLKFDPVRAVVL